MLSFEIAGRDVQIIKSAITSVGTARTVATYDCGTVPGATDINVVQSKSTIGLCYRCSDRLASECRDVNTTCRVSLYKKDIWKEFALQKNQLYRLRRAFEQHIPTLYKVLRVCHHTKLRQSLLVCLHVCKWTQVLAGKSPVRRLSQYYESDYRVRYLSNATCLGGIC